MSARNLVNFRGGAWTLVMLTCLALPGALAHRTLLAGDRDQNITAQKSGEHHFDLPGTIAEARGRAKLLHETIHGALQVMHRDFFRDEGNLSIPSHSLEDVFKELESSHGVKVRWLAVNARAMNVENEPKNDFERSAVTALAAGKEHVESIAEKDYHYAGRVRLASQCLKCHLPARSDNLDRAAGIVISMPVAADRK